MEHMTISKSFLSLIAPLIHLRLIFFRFLTTIKVSDGSDDDINCGSDRDSEPDATKLKRKYGSGMLSGVKKAKAGKSCGGNLRNSTEI